MNKLQQRWGKYVGQAACSHCHATFSGAYCPKCQSEEDDSVRVCSHCGQLMYSGYVCRDGLAYYCSDECLHQHLSAGEWTQAYADGDSYWTQWDD